MAADRRTRDAAIAAPELNAIDLSALATELRASGFKRELKSFQLKNLARILRLPHGADFSVPGAGKTTVALAAYALRKKRGEVDRLLVVAPIAAFGAWKDDSLDCFDICPALSVYDPTAGKIQRATEILLANYNRVANDYDVIRGFVAEGKTSIVLDEAHRIKRGSAGVHGRAVLDLAYAAKRRDVLTGTPAPQGAMDLVALVKFLYPGQDRQILPPNAFVERLGRDASVLAETHAAFAKYFVRTPKTELDLPPTEFKVVRRPMGPIQTAIYEALVGRYKGVFTLGDRNRHEMQRLGRVVMYLLEAATNPMLLTAGSDDGDDPGFTHPPIEVKGNERLTELLSRYGSFETPWKYQEALKLVRAAAEKGEKVLIWSNFVRNIRLLANLLSAYSPAVVHGGVPSEDSGHDDEITREGEFHRFRNDPKCSVLLANPAACGEGVSLHHWCHHAIYLDRSFNAGHFLQSQDRIHRLGLDKSITTTFTLLISTQTIDETVDGRLFEKVSALAALMDDRGLVQIALPAADEGEDGMPAFEDDYSAVAAHVSAHGS
jgi:SNF2 family DNA or RNA helicase